MTKIVVITGASSGFGAMTARALAEAGHLDVVVHNAEHMTLGPTEAFTVEQLAGRRLIRMIGTYLGNSAMNPRVSPRSSLRGNRMVWGLVVASCGTRRPIRRDRPGWG
jgi:hypothetical protein